MSEFELRIMAATPWAIISISGFIWLIHDLIRGPAGRFELPLTNTKTPMPNVKSVKRH